VNLHFLVQFVCSHFVDIRPVLRPLLSLVKLVLDVVETLDDAEVVLLLRNHRSSLLLLKLVKHCRQRPAAHAALYLLLLCFLRVFLDGVAVPLQALKFHFALNTSDLIECLLTFLVQQICFVLFIVPAQLQVLFHFTLLFLTLLYHLLNTQEVFLHLSVDVLLTLQLPQVGSSRQARVRLRVIECPGDGQSRLGPSSAVFGIRTVSLIFFSDRISQIVALFLGGEGSN